MKKIKSSTSIFLVFFIITVAHFSSVNAASPNISLYLNNQPLTASSPPYIEKGVTLVPMRLIFEALGADVAWFDETQTIMAKKGSTSITLTINKTTAFINTSKKTLPLAPQLKNGMTYVPLRFISESLGADVAWDGEKQRILIHAINLPEPSRIVPITSGIKKELSIQEIGKMENTIVFIYNDQVNGGASIGSGFVISEDGRIVTNYHVIANAKKLTISFDNDKEYADISILDYDIAKDLAVLKVNTKDKFPFVKLGDSNQATLGDSIFVIGNPMGLRNTLSTGIISSLKQQGYIQITAPISPGSSGGALFNIYGEVIGIASAAILEGQNLGFCIPINEIKNLSINKSLTLAELHKNENKLTPPQNVTAFALSSSEIAVQWDYNLAVDYYHVYYSATPNGKFIPFLDEQDNKARFDWDSNYSMSNYDLDSNQTVYYRVTAVKNGIESSFSQTVSAVTLKDDFNRWIELITEGYFEKYPKKKIGSAFNSFFEDAKWEYFRSNQGLDIVEFTGTYIYDGQEYDMLLQFSVNLFTNSFKVLYTSRNGTPLSRTDFDRFLTVVFR